MDLYRCIEVIEMDQASCDEEVIEALQYLYDTGSYKGLQGFYGRLIESAINAGVINTEKGEGNGH